MRHLVHTADAAVDPVSGYRYETRETGTAARFYRVIPNTAERTTDSGVFIMKVTGSPMANLGARHPAGITFEVEWLPADDSSPDGVVESAARFSRLEGCWYGNDARIYIVSSEPGRLGQVWAYDPLVETISLLGPPPYRHRSLGPPPRGDADPRRHRPVPGSGPSQISIVPKASRPAVRSRD